jgi:hypothetical protein
MYFWQVHVPYTSNEMEERHIAVQGWKTCPDLRTAPFR